MASNTLETRIEVQRRDICAQDASQAQQQWSPEPDPREEFWRCVWQAMRLPTAIGIADAEVKGQIDSDLHCGDFIGWRKIVVREKRVISSLCTHGASCAHWKGNVYLIQDFPPERLSRAGQHQTPGMLAERADVGAIPGPLLASTGLPILPSVSRERWTSRGCAISSAENPFRTASLRKGGCPQTMSALAPRQGFVDFTVRSPNHHSPPGAGPLPHKRNPRGVRGPMGLMRVHIGG
jgi:hypothetical protein